MKILKNPHRSTNIKETEAIYDTLTHI